MTIAETDRLYLRHMSTDDAAFILELVNESAWLEFIGDRGFAVLARYRGHSYAREAAKAAVASLTGLTRIHAPGIGHHHHRRASGLLACA